MSCIDCPEVQLRSCCCRRGQLLPGAAHVFPWSQKGNATRVLYVRNTSLGDITLELQWHEVQPASVEVSAPRGRRIGPHESLLLVFDQIDPASLWLNNLGRQVGRYELVLMAYRKE